MQSVLKVFMAAMAAVAMAIASGCDGGAPAGSPMAAAQAMEKASNSGDAAKMVAMWDKSSQAMLDASPGGRAEFIKMMNGQMAEKNKGKNPRPAIYKNEVITGDTATVEMTDVNADGTPGEKHMLHFVRENGEWKINMPKTFGPPGGG